ncbi:hypothetical protein CEXT_597091 [Caerostris extrusa]|uniref:Uncharacterized protein n=1 Tax=Caerostris extrusa TaxID=172846 RepID=A0AAV4XEW9_CAEEX|nr:hypothetical protein CEXT_597091 [Caerostris extrusa]
MSRSIHSTSRRSENTGGHILQAERLRLTTRPASEPSRTLRSLVTVPRDRQLIVLSFLLVCSNHPPLFHCCLEHQILLSRGRFAKTSRSRADHSPRLLILITRSSFSRN